MFNFLFLLGLFFCFGAASNVSSRVYMGLFGNNLSTIRNDLLGP